MTETDSLFTSLRELTQMHAPAGEETPLIEPLRAAFEPWADDVRVDALGNVFARARRAADAPAARPTLMLAAHTDEIGMSISRIEKGFLRVSAIGGVDPGTLLGREVIVHAKDRPLPGVIATIPPHLTDAEDRDKFPGVDKLWIDVGFDADTLVGRVQIGDRITLDHPLVQLLGERAAGKALDDRAGVLTLLAALRLLSRRQPAVDVVAVCTVQEEVGLRGARTSSFGLHPDLAIAVDVGFGDQPDVPARDTIKLGGGPSIGLGPSMHKGLHKRLTSVARAHKINHQIELLPGASGTDAWAIEVARGAIPCGLLSIPLRHMHSTSELIDLRDVAETARLIAEFAAEIDVETIEGWRHAAF